MRRRHGAQEGLASRQRRRNSRNECSTPLGHIDTATVVTAAKCAGDMCDRLLSSRLRALH